MLSLFKQCELCDGDGVVLIIDPITTEHVKNEPCPLCKGAGGFNILIGWNGIPSYGWRYRNTEENKGSGDNL